jgi:hypothetical protein
MKPGFARNQQGIFVRQAEKLLSVAARSLFMYP